MLSRFCTRLKFFSILCGVSDSETVVPDVVATAVVVGSDSTEGSASGTRILVHKPGVCVAKLRQSRQTCDTVSWKGTVELGCTGRNGDLGMTRLLVAEILAPHSKIKDRISFGMTLSG